MIEVVAEVGKNFVTTEQEESLDVLLARAKQYIDVIKKIGGTTVKFQVHTVKDEIHPETKIIAPHFNLDRYTWVKRNTYPVEFWWELKEYCREVGINFLATPMSRGAAELLNEDIGVDRWKIGSADILDFVMLDHIRDSGKPVILSSGMSTIQELKKSYDFLKEKTQDISILHCVSQYPCPIENLNLGTIPFLKKQFPGVKIGFSDHSLGNEGALVAAAEGASIIEKHLTLSRDFWGPDHRASSTPEEMGELIKRLKNNDLVWATPIHPALGVETKFVSQEEIKFRPAFHKGLYAARDIKAGEMFEPDMIYAMRPKLPDARPSYEYPNIVGKVASQDIKKYDPIP